MGCSLGLAACAGGGPAGDWDARALVTERGESAATGILEIDRDGETLLRVDAAGDGFVGTLRARGRADLDGDTAWLELVGELDPGGASVRVSGPCTAWDADLSCELDVNGESWWLELVRERDGLVDLD
jgi:hypothetical protein